MTAPQPWIVRGSHADLIRQELLASLRQPAFWGMAAREAIPVAGVFFLGWEPIYAGFFFVAESWLYMSTRAAAEEAYDVKSSSAAKDGKPLDKLLKFLGYLVTAMLVYGLVVGILGFFAIARSFPEDQWRALLTESWTQPTFLAGLAALLLTELYATWQFARGASGRSDQQREWDLVKLRAMYHRCFVLLCCTLVFGFLVGWTGGKAFVLIPFLVVLYFEACPREVARMVGRYKKR